MGNRILLTVCSILLLGLFGCASGHCWGRKGDVVSQERVFVAKPDGSLQCGKAEGKSAEKMSEELKDIEIYMKDKRSDGEMHMTVCGGPTGKENVYEIKKKDLAKAIKLGFKEVKKK